MPRGIPGSGPTSKIKKHYSLISGEIEYTETEGLPPKYMKVNGIHVDVSQKLDVKSLATIQTTLQMHFHTKYSKNHPSAPQITDAVINAITYLGSFTTDEFHKNAPAELKEEPTPKHVEVQVVPGKDPVVMVVPDAPKAEEIKPVEPPAAVIVPPVVAATPEPVKQPLVEVAELPKPVEPVVVETIAPPVAEALKTP